MPIGFCFYYYLKINFTIFTKFILNDDAAAVRYTYIYIHTYIVSNIVLTVSTNDWYAKQQQNVWFNEFA